MSDYMTSIINSFFGTKKASKSNDAEKNDNNKQDSIWNKSNVATSFADKDAFDKENVTGYTVNLGGIKNKDGQFQNMSLFEMMNTDAYKNASLVEKGKMCEEFDKNAIKGLKEYSSDQFNDYDLNGDGILTKDEVIQNEVSSGAPKELAEKFAKSLDFDGKDNISQDEMEAFVALMDQTDAFGVGKAPLDGNFTDLDIGKAARTLANLDFKDAQELLKNAKQNLDNMNQSEDTLELSPEQLEIQKKIANGEQLTAQEWDIYLGISD